jgi:hypothetical protein
VQSGLFREVPTFTALEASITALSTEQAEQDQADAFEDFAEAFLKSGDSISIYGWFPSN